MNLTILGAAESGIGAAILGQQKGYDVFVSDSGRIKDQYKVLLKEHSIPWEESGHTLERLKAADLIVKSPGIPESTKVMQELRATNVPIVSEIEFAGRYTKARKICITGSNGKTTTTSLIYHILQKAGYNVGLAGNIGQSFALQVARGDRDWYVIELSSFQLDDMYDFRADIAVLLNITPDHLDRYGFKMENYVRSKMRILQNQRAEDSFIFWDADDYIPSELQRLSPAVTLLPFSDTAAPTSAAFVEADKLTVRRPEAASISTDGILLPGRHNLRNCMAATLAALAAGVSPEVVQEGLYDFPGIEHRIEYAGELDGVRYVNDSKATNVDACRCALEAMKTPVVLILGGLDKGNDYAAIADLVREKCRALVFMGVDNEKLKTFFADYALPQYDTHSISDCFAACRSVAQRGDTVLLSPCCASFDLFRNMEDRGDQFKALIANAQVTA